MKSHHILEANALEQALQGERFLLFKHSMICPVSARAFREYAAFVKTRKDLPHGWIDVIGQRAFSERVAEATGVEHASPQVLLFENGAVSFDASHFHITVDRLAAAVHGAA